MLSRKRILDLLLIFLSVPITLPLFLLISIYIKVKSPGPIFFKQKRVGINGTVFEIFKFRTMKINAKSDHHVDHINYLVDYGRVMEKLDNKDNRIIPGCKFLRSSGLDELPQLINVLRGEMSLVGPRPCTLDEFKLFKSLTRFTTLPGLTGLWQVNGKNETTFRRMIELDEEYTRKNSVGMDLSIMLMTPLVLIRQVLNIKIRKTIPIVLKEFDMELDGG